MGAREKTDFGRLCRALRMARGMTQKQVAEQAGLKLATISTLEGSAYRVIATERARVLADRVFRIAGKDRDAFLAAHERTRVSPASKAREAQWPARNAVRSKLRNYDPLRRAACELALRFIQDMPVGEACRCDFGGGSYGDPHRPCEVCAVLAALGILGGLGDRERTLDRLARILARAERTAGDT